MAAAPPPVSQSTTSADYSDYIGNMLSKGLTFGNMPFTPYTGNRYAGPSALQTQAFKGIAGLQPPPQYQMATNTYQDAANRARGLGAYDPSQFDDMNLQQYQMQGPRNTNAQDATNYQMGRTGNVNAQDATNYQMKGPSNVSSKDLQDILMKGPGNISADAASRLRQYQMGGPERVSTGDFTKKGVAEKFMSPYIGNVIASQQRDADRLANIATTSRNAQAVTGGAFGGSRQAIMDAEAGRNLALQQGDIQAKGMQDAYTNAQQQFNTQQALGLQAQQSNQQAEYNTDAQNLAAKLGIQSLGFGADMQAKLANQQMGYNTNLQNLQSRLGTQNLEAQQNMQAQLANQQAGMTTAQQNLAARMGQSQFAAGQDMQAQLANQQMGYNTNAQNLAARMGQSQFAAGQDLQSQLANQQAQMATGRENLAARLGVQSLGVNQNLEGQRMDEQSRQFGANYGLQGLDRLLSAAGGLTNLGGYQGGTTNTMYNNMLNAGGIQQALNQQPLDFGYQQWDQSVNYPQTQAMNMQRLLSGLPLNAPGYTPAMSAGQAAVGGGLTGAALLQLLMGGKAQ